MTQNPYEPPKARLADDSQRRHGRVGEFDIGECLSDSWSLTWASFPTWLAIGFVGGLLLLASAMLVLPLLVVVPVLVWGTTLFYINVVDGQERFGDLFRGFSTYGSALLTMLGWYVATVLIGFIGQSVQITGSMLGSAGLLGLGVIFNLAWTVAVVSRLYFGPFFIVDQGMGAIEALEASWDATKQQKLRTAGLFVVSSLVGMLGLFALLVGVVVSLNMFFLMWASGYRQMVPSLPEAPTEFLDPRANPLPVAPS